MEIFSSLLIFLAPYGATDSLPAGCSRLAAGGGWRGEEQRGEAGRNSSPSKQPTHILRPRLSFTQPYASVWVYVWQPAFLPSMQTHPSTNISDTIQKHPDTCNRAT